MTSPRMIVSGATTAITRRTTLHKAFLSPWDPLVKQCWLYALADAQRQTGMAIHHGNLVINHERTIATMRHAACSTRGRAIASGFATPAQAVGSFDRCGCCG
jgi:hypothetical protein